MRRTLLLLLLLALTLTLSVVGAEVVLRVMNLYAPPSEEHTARNTTLYRAHEIVGYNLWPSASMAYRYPDNSPELLPVVSNSDGFRNRRDFGPERLKRRVIVTGDSFVFGDGVRAEERVSNRLESLLPATWVDNLGMTGWGVDNMLRASRWIAPKVQPDLLLVCIYTDDFRRVDPYYTGIGFAQPRFVLEGEELVSVPYPALSRLERTRINQARVQLGFKYSDYRWRIHEVMLNEFRALATENAFELAFVFFPATGDNEKDRTQRRWLSDYGERHGVPVLDLTDSIHGAGVDRTYIHKNWHWNGYGHEIAAAEIAPFLRENFPALWNEEP